MYARLIFKNMKRSVKDYLIYLVTMTVCVTLFYAFLSISSNDYDPPIGAEYDFTMLSDGMKLTVCAVALLLLFLIRFVSRYMLKSRFERICGTGMYLEWNNERSPVCFLRRRFLWE